MLVSVKEMGFKMIVERDSICVQESARDIVGTWAMGGYSESHHGGSVWVSFTGSMGQGQDYNTVFGGHGR